MDLDRLKQEAEEKLKKELQFNKKYVTPLKDFTKHTADVKYNETAIIREEHNIKLKEQAEKDRIKKIMIEGKDSAEFERWRREMEEKDDLQRMEEVMRRKIELEMSREAAVHHQQLKLLENQKLAAEYKQQEAEKLAEVASEKIKELEEKQILCKEIKEEKKNIGLEIEKLKVEKREAYNRQQEEKKKLEMIALEEKKVENERRNDIIRQIRELEKLPVKRTKGFDPTETRYLLKSWLWFARGDVNCRVTRKAGIAEETAF